MASHFNDGKTVVARYKPTSQGHRGEKKVEVLILKLTDF